MPNPQIDIPSLKKFLLELAIYQDQLLQSYRTIFISSQAIVISIAMLLASYDSKNNSILFIILFAIGIFFLYIWLKITPARELDVSYCHMQLLRLEEKKLAPNNPTDLEEMEKPWYHFKRNWQNKSKEEKKQKIRELCYADLLESPSRKMMGIWLPLIFIIIWLIGLTVVLHSIFF